MLIIIIKLQFQEFPVGRDLLRKLVGTCSPDTYEGMIVIEGGPMVQPGSLTVNEIGIVQELIQICGQPRYVYGGI